jgi:hypothetical protein
MILIQNEGGVLYQVAEALAKVLGATVYVLVKTKEESLVPSLAFTPCLLRSGWLCLNGEECNT